MFHKALACMFNNETELYTVCIIACNCIYFALVVQYYTLVVHLLYNLKSSIYSFLYVLLQIDCLLTILYQLDHIFKNSNGCNSNVCMFFSWSRCRRSTVWSGLTGSTKSLCVRAWSRCRISSSASPTIPFFRSTRTFTCSLPQNNGSASQCLSFH